MNEYINEPSGNTVSSARRRVKRKRKSFVTYRYLLILAVLAIVTVVSTTAAIINYNRYRRQQKAVVEAGLSNPSYSLDTASHMAQAAEAQGQQKVLDNMINSFSQGTSTTAYLRSIFKDKIVYPDSGKYVFIDINKSLPMHNLNLAAFSKDAGGFMTYSDAAVQTHRGIDVSRYQGDIDWALVKNDGIEYAFLRVGYRSYGTGVIKEDEFFKINAANALQNNLHVGVYFFTQAVNTAEAEEEAQFVIDSIKPFKIDYPIVIDVEEIVNDTYRQQNMTQQELTDVVIAFCEKIKQAGYTPMIYANIKGFTSLIDINRIAGYEKWYADYNNVPYMPYDMSVWQYSDSGKVNGVSSDVDLNISFKTW